jgi:hypothetical protein
MTRTFAVLQSSREPYKWGVCRKPRCRHRIRSKNKSGLCKPHYDEEKNRKKRAKLITEKESHKKETLANLLGLSELPTPEELRLDIAWEARHSIANFVGCRHCGDFFKTPLRQNHLKKIGMTADEYHSAYPGARLWSFAYAAAANAKSGVGSAGIQELMTNFAELYVAADQLIECRKDTGWGKSHNFVVCRMCGRKVHGWLPTHLQLKHQKMTIDEYLTIWPNAPTQSEFMRTRHAETSKRTWRRNKQQVEDAKRILAQQAQQKPKPKRGKPKKSEEKKSYVTIGRLVEERISVNLKESRRAVIAARQAIASENPEFEADVVAEYHKRYRRSIRNGKLT